MPTSQGNTDDFQDSEYTIMRLSETNLADLAILHAAVYNTTVNIDYFTRKYDTAYTGTVFLGYLAYNPDGIPVAYYGAIPCFITYEDNSVLAAQAADIMTHPQYRYKGLFVKLSNMLFDLCRQENIEILFGFPNQNFSAAVLNKSIWKTLHTMDYFVIPVSALPLESLSLKVVPFNKIYRCYRNYILQMGLTQLRGVRNSVLAYGFAGINRNDGYLNYKTFSSLKVIKAGESKVWIKGDAGLIIGDMEGVNKINFNLVIAKLKKVARKLGVRKMYFHCSPDIELHQLFLTKYEPRPSFPVFFQDFGFKGSHEKIKFTFADIDIF